MPTDALGETRTEAMLLTRQVRGHTKLSWHCSANHHRPLADFVTRMQSFVRPGSLFGAESMMPTEPRHAGTEHYTSPEKLSRHFNDQWQRAMERFSDLGFRTFVDKSGRVWQMTSYAEMATRTSVGRAAVGGTPTDCAPLASAPSRTRRTGAPSVDRTRAKC
ncbi:phage minor capsid protein [Streptomyces sp. NBC_00620]|uniref:phage minor capsid protein n=1 Tax=Streptomyces sp. NBC_00620 TaxID=2903666 RepID=UPI00225AC947|nr:phage minor capsid protein [Streptomyces sp. NBC_00620]MCX4975012.1 phage minor capsid protein [Streptomyces sp. NBC_00620]